MRKTAEPRRCLRLVVALTFLTAVASPAATKIETVYIVPSSHWDRGFVAPPDQIPAMAARHLDEVIDAAEKDPDFRWTIESVWQVLAFLDANRGLGDILPGRPARIEALMRLIRSGHIDLSAAWGSMHTEFMGTEELNRLMYDFAALRRAYGIDSKIAMLDDVPGQPYRMASVLAGSGVRYLLLGANQFVGGGTSLAPGNVPFYWEGPDGQRVLTWVSQSPRGGYTEGITDFFLDPFTHDPYTQTSVWTIFHPQEPEKDPLETMQAGMDELLARLGRAGYPYDAVLVMHLHDFLHPSTVANLERAVRLWNSAHKTPVLRMATASEFFRYMEEKYGAKIPVVKGEWSGLWSEAKTSSPRISALARQAHDDVPAAETLWSALAADRGLAFPAGDFYSLYQLLFQHDEHSGAGNAGWPGLNERAQLEEQNREYVRHMQEAAGGADYLLRTGIGLAASGPQAPQRVRIWPLAVWNPLSWRRTDAVTVAPPEKAWQIVAVRDRRDGASVPFDIDADGNALFLARDVPSIGYAMFDIECAPGNAHSTLKPEPALTAGNSRLRVKLRRDGTIESIFDVRAGRELVNPRAVTPFNHLLRIVDDQPADLPMPFAAGISEVRGRVMTQFQITRTGSPFAATRIQLYDGLDRVEIHNDVNPERLPFASIRSGGFDSYYFCFPFALDPGTLTVHPEEQHGFVSLPGDYLPGARRDSMTSLHAVALTDRNATVLLAHRQAFHFVFPGYVRTERTKEHPAFPAMFTGKWPLPEATLYSRAFRHTSQGDMRLAGVVTFPTVEPGMDEDMEFDYAVSPAPAPLDGAQAMRFGAEFDVPLRAVYVALPGAAEHSFFAVDQPNIRIDTVKEASAAQTQDISPTKLEIAAQHRRFVIRLQEVAGMDTPRAAISLPGRVRRAEIVDLTEDKVLAALPAGTPLVVALRPYATLTVRFELEEAQ